LISGGALIESVENSVEDTWVGAEGSGLFSEESQRVTTFTNSAILTMTWWEADLLYALLALLNMFSLLQLLYNKYDRNRGEKIKLNQNISLADDAIQFHSNGVLGF